MHVTGRYIQKGREEPKCFLRIQHLQEEISVSSNRPPSSLLPPTQTLGFLTLTSKDFEGPRTLSFRLPAGPKSAPVTYTPKSGPLALGDPQPGASGCATFCLTLAPRPRKSRGRRSPCAQRPLLVLQLIKLWDFRPLRARRLKLPAVPGRELPGSGGDSGGAGELVRTPTQVFGIPLRGTAPGASAAGSPSQGSQLSRGARRAVGHRSHWGGARAAGKS